MKTENMGAPTVRRALLNLWEKSSQQMNPEELEWFAGFVEQAHLNAEDLAETVAGIGYLIGNDENGGNLQSKHSVMTLLISLSQQIDAIAGMIYIGDCATDRLINPERYQRQAVDNETGNINRA
ncbi:hypothetical protein NP590_05445 [Methylomonas sp. SURF-2]|uniref:Uncharacterized protein n=1 Tax=Methylomonas subterranea TaxID=2952225 RepID=A0ABT1TDL0_9GAMM|nr:hypothetical protein [Methylomonas sp. SURF-2]MCQ8103543.1 hypothetical protein [Methylomonas sp. SURF-2]